MGREGLMEVNQTLVCQLGASLPLLPHQCALCKPCKAAWSGAGLGEGLSAELCCSGAAGAGLRGAPTRCDAHSHVCPQSPRPW